MQHQSTIIVEKTNLDANTYFGYHLKIPYNYIIYFEKEPNKELNLYIKTNYKELKARFNSLGFNFIYLPYLTKDVEDVEKAIRYYIPQFNCSEFSEEFSKIYTEKTARRIASNNTNAYQELLKLVDYKGGINSGLLFFEPQTGVIGASDFFNSNPSKDYTLFFEDVISFFKIEEEESDDFPAFDYSEKLDDDAKQIIKYIEHRLFELKDSGQLLFIIPVLKDLFQKQSESIKWDVVNKLEISSQNKILLPYFKSEIELSHLTKAIYFLFLKHPEGINLKELESHKKELFTIYVSVSNQLDYDKMTQRIEDVVNLESKAIYTHLSRIKSAFYKIMDESYAKYYIVSGSRDENRRVLINASAVFWNNVDLLDDLD